MTTEEVKRALVEAGKIHGDSTVAIALATLTNTKKLLDNKREKDQRGYAFRS
jgi:hypothetical protein